MECVLSGCAKPPHRSPIYHSVNPPPNTISEAPRSHQTFMGLSIIQSGEDLCCPALFERPHRLRKDLCPLSPIRVGGE